MPTADIEISTRGRVASGMPERVRARSPVPLTRLSRISRRRAAAHRPAARFAPARWITPPAPASIRGSRIPPAGSQRASAAPRGARRTRKPSSWPAARSRAASAVPRKPLLPVSTTRAGGPDIPVGTAAPHFQLVSIRVLLWVAVAGLAAAAARAPVAPSGRCVVARIVDGDTFSCADGLKVRLIGMDSPERGQPGYGAAREALARLAGSGDTVRLERDVGLEDRYGRRRAWVWRGGTLVNEALVAEGWAVLYTVPPNVKYEERLEAAQTRARAGRRGLWRTDAFSCEPRAWRQHRC